MGLEKFTEVLPKRHLHCLGDLLVKQQTQLREQFVVLRVDHEHHTDMVR